MNRICFGRHLSNLLHGKNIFKDQSSPLKFKSRKNFPLLVASTAMVVSLLNGAVPGYVTPAHSQVQQQFAWKNVNIQGMGYVTGLVVSPVAPHNVYIRTDVGGAYRFDRTNGRWVPIMDMFDSSFSGGGIGVESVAVDRVNANRVYVAVNRGGSIYNDGKQKYKFSGEVMVSNDAGKSWQPTGLGSMNVYMGPNASYRSDSGERIAIDPNKPDLLYFSSRRDGLWKKDGNSGWVRVSNGLPSPSSLPGFKNPDGSDNLDLPGYTFVAFDQNAGTSGSASRTIYVGVHGSGVWRSTDGGNSWSNIGGSNNPLRGAIARDGTLYVSYGTWGGNGVNTSGSVRRFRSGGWADITPGGGGRVYAGITVDPTNPNTVMVVSDRYVYRSTNGGTNWSTQTLYMGAYDANSPQDPVNSTAPGYYKSYAATGAAALVIDPLNPKQVWWTNGWGVARTDDVTVANPNYKWLMNNLEELDSNMVRVPPKPKVQGGADLLSAVQDTIGFRHENRDIVPKAKIDPANIPINPAYKWANPDWTVYPQPFPHVAGGTGMDYSYNNPDHAAFVGFHQWQGFWPIHGYTSDNGRTWNAFASIPTQLMWNYNKTAQEQARAIGGQIAMSPTNPQNMVWAPTWGTMPHYTIDGGRSWKLATNLNAPPQLSPYDPKNNDHVYYQALPNSWSNSISPWLSSYVLAADRKDPAGKTFYYYANGTFYYSNDGGAYWRKGATNLPTWLIRPTVVANPTQQNDVWISFARNPEDVNGNKLYRSIDGGKTFNVVASVATCEYVTFGRGSTDTNPFIYIYGKVGNATKDAMYKSENMGQTWIQISDPNVLQFPGINYLEGDMRSPNLVYVSISGRGVMYGSR